MLRFGSRTALTATRRVESGHGCRGTDEAHAAREDCERLDVNAFVPVAHSESLALCVRLV